MASGENHQEDQRPVRHSDLANASPSGIHLSVAAPCFNEADGIEAVVADWDAILDRFSGASEIVLCNDGSTDDTPNILKHLCAHYPRLRVVDLEVNCGYGRALGTAIEATRGEFVVTIDSDGQFDLADAALLLAELERGGFDCVTGFRRGKKDSGMLVLADRGLNLLVRSLFGVRLRDTNCALKVIRGDLARTLLIEACGYPMPTEIVIRLHERGYRVHERGVAHRHRDTGTSKLRAWHAAWSMFRFLGYLRTRRKLFRAGIIVEP